jgi:hypothetical protein
MNPIPPEFALPAPADWEPKVGERVLLFFRDKVFEGEIISLLERGYLVSAETLILPVACSRDSLRPSKLD